MTNEEKILKILETMQADIANLKEGQASLQGNIADLNRGQAAIQDDVAALKEGQASLQGNIADLNRGQAAMQDDVAALKEGQASLESRIDKLELRIENEVIDKIRALYDAREVQNDINERIVTALNRIEAKVDVLQMETASIRRIK